MITAAISVYAVSVLYLLTMLIYDEYKWSKKEVYHSFTYGELLSRILLSAVPVVNTTIGVCFIVDFIGKKLKKVWSKQVFK